MWLVRAEMGLHRGLQAGDRATREELVALVLSSQKKKKKKKNLLLLFLISPLYLSPARELARGHRGHARGREGGALHWNLDWREKTRGSKEEGLRLNG